MRLNEKPLIKLIVNFALLMAVYYIITTVVPAATARGIQNRTEEYLKTKYQVDFAMKNPIRKNNDIWYIYAYDLNDPKGEFLVVYDKKKDEATYDNYLEAKWRSQIYPVLENAFVDAYGDGGSVMLDLVYLNGAFLKTTEATNVKICDLIKKDKDKILLNMVCFVFLKSDMERTTAKEKMTKIVTDSILDVAGTYRVQLALVPISRKDEFMLLYGDRSSRLGQIELDNPNYLLEEGLVFDVLNCSNTDGDMKPVIRSLYDQSGQ